MYWSGMRSAWSLRSLSWGIAVLMVTAAFAGTAAPDDTLSRLREEFRRETDPVKRAKRFAKFGNALIREMREQESAQKFEAITPLFREYHDDAASAFDGLIATGRDAEKHPQGFRELELQFRESVHALNDLLFAVPLEDREAVRKGERDIESMDDRLIQLLFPRTPERRKTPPSSPGAHPL